MATETSKDVHLVDEIKFERMKMAEKLGERVLKLANLDKSLLKPGILQHIREIAEEMLKQKDKEWSDEEIIELLDEKKNKSVEDSDFHGEFPQKAA